MFINGITDYDRSGKEVKTGFVIAKATCDGDIRITSSGKEVGSISVRAYGRKDGTAAFLTVKGWGHLARQLSVMVKGDRVIAAGREHNGKTYTDLIADYVWPTEKESHFPIQSGGVNVSAADFAEIGEEDGKLPF